MSKHSELLKRQLKHARSELEGLRARHAGSAQPAQVQTCAESRVTTQTTSSPGSFKSEEGERQTKSKRKANGEQGPSVIGSGKLRGQIVHWIFGVGIGALFNNISNDPRILYFSATTICLWLGWHVWRKCALWKLGGFGVCLLLFAGAHRLVYVQTFSAPPKVAIVADQMTNPLNPTTTQFEVRNDGPLDLNDVIFGYYIQEIHWKDESGMVSCITNITVSENPAFTKRVLPSGGRATFPFNRLVVIYYPVLSAHITVWARFRPSYALSHATEYQGKYQAFYLVRNKDGTARWNAQARGEENAFIPP